VEQLNTYLKKSYKKLLEISRRITSEKYPDYEDLLHETIEALYNSDQEKIKGIIERKQLTFYIVRIMMNQYQSNTSPYHIKYRRYYDMKNNIQRRVKENDISSIYIYNKEPLTKERLKEFEDKEKQLQWIEEKLKGLKWFDVSVFKLYYNLDNKDQENFSLNSMSRATKINRSTLGKSIRYIKNFLKNERTK
tara:strand:- start:53 stop:628 length:576 start_codon:yes stop_codon:yes gene_type:complete